MTEDRIDASAASSIADELQLLARLHDRELDAGLIAALREHPVAEWFSLRLEGPAFEEAAKLVEQAFAELPDPLTDAVLDDLAAEYAAIYLTHAYRVSPNESVWRDEDGLERQAPMFAVRSWYRRCGLQVADWRKRSEDHIAVELAFLARLMRGADDPGKAREAAAFMREHLLAWCPDFVARVVQRCQSPLYAGTALLTAAYLGQLASALAQVLNEDMTAVTMKASPALADAGLKKTCGDPSPSYAPGAGPGW